MHLVFVSSSHSSWEKCDYALICKSVYVSVHLFRIKYVKFVSLKIVYMLIAAGLKVSAAQAKY